MISPTNEPVAVAVTLTPELYARLAEEAKQTGIALEWLVASLVVDTIDRSRTSIKAA